MLTSVRANEAFGDEVVIETADRRALTRQQSTYRPCCVIHRDRISMGLIRNFSPNGACIESDVELNVGDFVRYFWDTTTNIGAKVAWRNCHNYGLEHVEEIVERKFDFPARSVRVPCKAEAQCWVRGESHSVQVDNISLGGMRISGLMDVEPGALMTVCFCGLEIPSASVRWIDGDTAGVRFATRLTREQLAQIILQKDFMISGIEFDEG